MKILEVSDESIFIQCEKYEPSGLNIGSLIPISLLLLAIVANPQHAGREIDSGQHWLSLGVVVSSVGIWTLSLMYDFLKPINRRGSHKYQINRDGVFSDLEIDAPSMDRINVIDVIVSLPDITDRLCDSYEEENYNYSTMYVVKIGFKSGSMIELERNELSIYRSEDNQVGFRKLIADTNTGIQRIRDFLELTS
jgi:hypothetical protein